MKTMEFFHIQRVSTRKKYRLIKLLLPDSILALYTRPHKQYLAILERLYSLPRIKYARFALLSTLIVKLLTFVLKQESDWFDYIIPYRVAADVKGILPLECSMVEWHCRDEINLINEKKERYMVWYNA